MLAFSCVLSDIMLFLFFFFFFNDTATTEIYTLSLHDALPICWIAWQTGMKSSSRARADSLTRSEEHTSELQSRQYLVCRLLLEKKKTNDLHNQRRIPSCDRSRNLTNTHTGAAQTNLGSVARLNPPHQLRGVRELLIFFLMIRRPPRSTLFPTRRSSDLSGLKIRVSVVRFRPWPPARISRTSDRKSTRLNSSPRQYLVCRLLLEKKKKKQDNNTKKQKKKKNQQQKQN